MFIVKTLVQVEEEVINNTLDSKANISDEDFGEPIKGSNDEEKFNKLKDPNITPPELSG